MNKKLLFLSLIISFISLMSCKNISSGTSDDKILVKFRINNSSRAAIGSAENITSLPDEYDENDLSYTLSYCSDGNWNDANLKNFSSLDEFEEGIELEPGNWSFKIDSFVSWLDDGNLEGNERNVKIAHGEVLDKNISQSTVIGFNLEFAPEEGEKGFSYIKVIYSNNFVDKIKIEYIGSDNKTAYENTYTNLSKFNNSQPVETYLAPDSYVVKITFFAGEKQISKTMFLRVLPNHKTIVEKNFNDPFTKQKVYSITYKDFGGRDYSGDAIEDSQKFITETETEFELPSPAVITSSDNELTFDGWYTYDALTSKYEAIEGGKLDGSTLDSDINVFAKWSPKYVYLNTSIINDNGTGFTYDNPVKTVKTAKSLIGSTTEAIEVMGIISSADDIDNLRGITTEEFNNVIIQRHPSFQNGPLIESRNNNTITNLIIDGGNISARAPCIYVYDQTKLILENVTIQNNKNISNLVSGIENLAILQLDNVQFINNSNCDIYLNNEILNSTPILYSTTEYPENKIIVKLLNYPGESQKERVLYFGVDVTEDTRQKIIDVFDVLPDDNNVVYPINLDGYLVNPNLSGGGSIVLPENQNVIFTISKNSFESGKSNLSFNINAYNSSVLSSNIVTDDISNWNIAIYSGSEDVTSEFEITENTSVKLPLNIAPGSYVVYVRGKYKTSLYGSSLIFKVEFKENSTGGGSSSGGVLGENELNFSDINYNSSDTTELNAKLQEIKSLGYDSVSINLDSSFADENNELLAGILRQIGSNGITTTKLNISVDTQEQCVKIKDALAGSDGSSSKLILDFSSSPLTSLGSECKFMYKQSISEIILPPQLEEIPSQFLAGARGIESIVIPASVTKIYGMAFMDSSIKNIIFEDSTSTWSVNLDQVSEPADSAVSVADSSLNASLLSSTYNNYIWTKN